MQITLTTTNTNYALAKLYTLNPEQHAAHMFEHWAACARQKHPGLTDEQLMALPTLAEQEQQREQEAQAAALAAEQHQQAIAAVLARAPESQREGMRQKLSEPNATLEQAESALADAVQAEQERIEQEAQRAQAEAAQAAQQAAQRKQEFMAMLADPELLAAAAAAQGKKLADA